MTDVEKLKEKIRDTGLTMTAIGRRTGMTRETLYNKIMAQVNLKHRKLQQYPIFCNYQMKREIKFFCSYSELNSTKIQENT